MKASRSLLLSCLLAIALGHSVAASNLPRQTPSIPPASTGTGTGTTETPPPKDTGTPTGPSTPVIPPPSGTSAPPDTNTSISPPVTPSASSNPPSDTSKNSDTNTATPPPDPSTNTPILPPVNTSLSTSTDDQGVEVTVTLTKSASSTTDVPSETSSQKPNDSSGLGIGPIIGMSVAGGVAVIAIIGFFVWKFTRKRFSDFDDNEAIKWPELNAHGGNVDSHPLPVHNTGRSGFDTGSETSLSRAPSTSNYSTPDIGSGVGHDPYAVPPLPHLNPNQPYRDDPNAITGYYDPYRGPVPGTLDNPGGEWGGEAIPMTQMAGNAGRMSPLPPGPGPNAAYGGEPPYDVGRRSPGPQAAYAMGRSSPGPQAAYGGGRASPGPQAVYSGGRMSPGPHAAYDYGARQ